MDNKVTIGNGWFASVLGLIFITLKLTGVITWSWWWVLSPFWIPVAIFLVAFLVIITIAFIKTYKD
jgi:hypothetical protein